jgi:membrane dipeptidase
MPGDFDFGLTAAQEARAAKLHADRIVFDWLSQHVGGPNIFAAYPPDLQAEFRAMVEREGPGYRTYLHAMYWPYQMAYEGRSQLVRDWYFASGMTCGAYHIRVHDGADRPEDSVFARYGTMPWLRTVTTAAEVRRAKADGVVALYANCQPTDPIPRNLAAIDRAYAKGLRSLMLTYNRMDHVGVGCTERVDAGLSMFGVDVVRHCEKLGLIVDASHCGHLTTVDACKVARRPVNANHTCAKAVSDVARAKSDDALKAIAGTGGIIGVVAVPNFISLTPEPTINAVLDHIEYIAGLVGWRHVSLGTDWPLQVTKEALILTIGEYWAELGFRPGDRMEEAAAKARTIGFEDYRDLPNITRGMVARGFSDEQISGILGENALRVFAEVCG